MKLIKTIVFSFLLIISITNCIVSCDYQKIENPTLQKVTNFTETGLLGEYIIIDIENLMLDSIQVYFDDIRASVRFGTETQILVEVPRSLNKEHATLRVYDLEESVDILNQTFKLRQPLVTEYNNSEIGFDETLTIYGENFDTDKKYVEVYINDKKGEIISVTHNELEVIIPLNLKKQELDVIIKSQNQTSDSAPSLMLRKPVIDRVFNTSNLSEGVLLGQKIYLSGSGLNHDNDFAELYVNGTKVTSFTGSNSELSFYIPYHSYKQFKITDIQYKTAGYELEFTTDIKINNHAIGVDELQNINGYPIVYGNNAYAYTFDSNLKKAVFYEFSLETEKWSKLPDFEIFGYISDVVSDNKGSIYVYASAQATWNDNQKTLYKLDLISKLKSTIELPFTKPRSNCSIFYFKDALYILYGTTIDNFGSQIKATDGYKYNDIDTKWVKTSSNLFTDYKWKSGKISKLFYFNKELYLHFSFSTSGTETYKLNDDFSVTKIITHLEMLFAYRNNIFGRQSNIVDGTMYLNSITDYNYTNMLTLRFQNSPSTFFSINDIVYYNSGGITFRTKNGLFDDLF